MAHNILSFVLLPVILFSVIENTTFHPDEYNSKITIQSSIGCYLYEIYSNGDFMVSLCSWGYDPLVETDNKIVRRESHVVRLSKKDRHSIQKLIEILANQDDMGAWPFFANDAIEIRASINGKRYWSLYSFDYKESDYDEGKIPDVLNLIYKLIELSPITEGTEWNAIPVPEWSKQIDY